MGTDLGVHSGIMMEGCQDYGPRLGGYSNAARNTDGIMIPQLEQPPLWFLGLMIRTERGPHKLFRRDLLWHIPTQLANGLDVSSILLVSVGIGENIIWGVYTDCISVFRTTKNK